MLNNYFDNSSMLSIYQNIFKKAMIQKIYCVVSFQTNVKNNSDKGKGMDGKFLEINRKNLVDEHGHV